MKKWIAFLLASSLLLLSACGTEFDGSRTGNDSELAMKFKKFNTTDSQELNLTPGDIIHAEVSLDKGSLAFNIQSEDGETIYESSGITGSYTFDTAPEKAGTCTVTVTGNRASGSLRVGVENGTTDTEEEES